MATRQWIKVGAALAAGAAGLSAQSLFGPGSDPVSISRSGAGVAYGRSLEAAGLNPALLTTLTDARSAYLALGLDSQGAFTTLQGNQNKSYSDDRNRAIQALGAAWVLRPGLAVGFVLDDPFRRQAELRTDSEARFLGDQIEVMSRRLEAQAAWTPEGRPDWSFGVGVGVTRVELGLGSAVRAVVPLDPTQPESAGNPAADITEFRLREKGSKVVPTFTLGARWAVSPRWTLGASFQSGIKADLLSEASLKGSPVAYDSDGFSAPTAGAYGRAATFLGLSQIQHGTGDFKIPPRLTVGVRQRLNQLFTWEADLRLTFGGVAYPTFAAMQTPNGAVTAPAPLPEGGSTRALLLMGEVTLGKYWVVRGGASLESAALSEDKSSPLAPTGAQAAFSAGAGLKVWGGELSVGYQYRNPRKQDRFDLAGDWAQSGFRPNNSFMRVEGVGHLFALGFRRAF